MRLYQKVFTRFIEWLHPEYSYLFVNDLPVNIIDKTIYIVGQKEHPWLIVFNCPCGCHSPIQLNLLKEGDPCWKFKISNNKKINISPSVWRIVGCKSHFIVRNSKIGWVKYYDQR